MNWKLIIVGGMLLGWFAQRYAPAP